MIKNTDLFYVKAKQFQDKRAAIVDGYEKKLKELERFKGSEGYKKDLEKMQKDYEADLKALRDEYRPGFQTIFGGMMDAIGKRSVSAPTNEQINLLNVLKMKRKVTLEELQRTAEAVKNNPIALSVVTEIAHDHNFLQTFNHLCPEMSSQTASDVVTGMKNGIEDFLQHDTTKASRIAKKYYEERYGQTDTPLTKRQLFTDKNGCFHDLAGLDGETMKSFSEIVDGVDS